MAVLGAVLLWSKLSSWRQEPSPRSPVIIVNQRPLPKAAPGVLDAEVRAAGDEEPDARDRRRPLRHARPRALPKFDQKMGATAFRRAESQLRKCLGRHSGGERELELLIVTTVTGSGRVKGVRLQPVGLQETPLGRCILAVARTVKYPPHADSEVDFKQPLRVARQL
jgi:hypothetical protein